jgi:membrane protein
MVKINRLLRFWRSLQKAFVQWLEDDGSTLAASVSYYTIFSLFPLLMILTSVLGIALRFSPEAQSAQEQLIQLLDQNVAPTVGDQVGTILAQVRTKAFFGGPVALVALLMGAMAIFAQFERAFDKIWKTGNPQQRGILAIVRNALWARLRAFLILLGLGAVIVVVFAVGLVLATVRPLAEELSGGPAFWMAVQTPLIVALYFAVFLLVYKVLPKVRVRWSEAAQGAILAAVLWEVGRELLAFALRSSRYSAYGVFGSLIIIMVWIYVATSILFLGAEYVSVVCRECRPEEEQQAPE